MKKTATFSLLLSLFVFVFCAKAFAQPTVTLTSEPVAAANLTQGSTNNIVYVVKMSVSNQAVTVNNVQVVLGGTHDANDISVLRIYFNASAPTVAGSTNLNGAVANFAAPHTYSIPVSQALVAGSEGYFIVIVDIASDATDGHTVKVNGATDPVVFGYSVAPTLTNSQTNAAGTQTVQAADVTVTSSAVAAASVPQATTNQIVYVAQMNVTTQNVVVNNVQVPLLGTHDANDLSVIRVYFNASAPTVAGSTNLNGAVANFAAPHTYSIPVAQAINAGSSGYFIVIVDVSATATDAKTIKVNGATDPLVFGFTTNPNLTNNQTNAAGTQTVQAADVTVSSSAVSASFLTQGSTNQIVYVAQMNVSTQNVVVNSVEVPLLGTHDANDLSVVRVYFNGSAPTVSGSTNLNGAVANFAAPHTYSIPVSQSIAAGGSGYFIIIVDVSATATDANTIKVNGATDPLVFGFTTAPNITDNQTNSAGTQTVQAANMTITSTAVPASNIIQGSTNQIVYIAQMNVTTQNVVVNNVQVPFLGTHDANDLSVVRVYFNASAPTVAGSTNLNGAVANFAAPHTYSIPVSQALVAGSSGYFIIIVDVNATASDGKTLKVNGATDPLVFGFTTAPNVTDNQTNAAGTQTIQASDVTVSSSPVPASNFSPGSTNNIVYVAQMNVSAQNVVVNNVQVPLLGTHDANDLSVVRVYFNGSAPTVSGSTNLNGAVANFAAPHTYSIPVSQSIAAGGSGYFLIVVDVDAAATMGNTIKINGATDPLVFGFTTGPNLADNQTDAAGTQTVGIPLPVVFTLFTAKAEGEAVTVKWKTASEKSNAYFDVEHSTNGNSFRSIGQVKGKGDSQAEQAYEFLHKSPQAGVNYYRLKQVDVDGGYTYTGVLQVLINSNARWALTVKNNPVQNTLQYRLASPEETKLLLRLVDASGKEMLRKTESVTEGENNLQLPANGFANGIYYLQVLNEKGTILNQKLMIRR